MTNPDFENCILNSDEAISLALSILDAFHGVRIAEAKAALEIAGQLIETNTIFDAQSAEIDAARTAFAEHLISNNEQTRPHPA